MRTKVQGVVETSDGVRLVAEGVFFGTRVRVVTAYDGTYDAFPFHVYVQAGHSMDSLTPKPTTLRQATKKDAIEQGLLMAEQYLSSDPHFQRSLQTDPWRA